ncbi:MbtH family protein [Xanthomonas arboricola]|uniref:MbtH family protein n=1 Tax=Xanthomonas arboricola TaxID=56448 RepID=UPI000CEE6F2A|nr:MbtH family NRPS accessory protein [Xanthomonas arboricola]PPT26473.1 MbtH family protein [Xanthomonas arboricola]
MKDSANHDDYFAVVNDEEQYSIWPAWKAIPPGWCDAGKRGTKEECLNYIEVIWTDITPKSVRERLAEQRKG